LYPIVSRIDEDLQPDEDKLKIWKADFGVEFSVKESPKFMGKFYNHRFNLIANKETDR